MWQQERQNKGDELHRVQHVKIFVCDLPLTYVK